MGDNEMNISLCLFVLFDLKTYNFFYIVVDKVVSTAIVKFSFVS